MPLAEQSDPADDPFTKEILHSEATFFTIEGSNVHLVQNMEKSISKSLSSIFAVPDRALFPPKRPPATDQKSS